MFDTWLWLRRLVILRKGFGILSASIIVGFMLASMLSLKGQYFVQMLTLKYWSFENYAFFAHIGDITGVLLLATSNIFSQRLLKKNWKRIQRLSYVYFYAGALYEAYAFQSIFALYALLVVTNVTVLAWAIKKWTKVSSQHVVTA